MALTLRHRTLDTAYVQSDRPLSGERGGRGQQTRRSLHQTDKNALHYVQLVGTTPRERYQPVIGRHECTC